MTRERATPKRAAIYTRISKDRDGTMLGVARQEAACRKHAGQLRWTVVAVYEDDDESAYVADTRPEFNRMLDDIKNGLIDGVIVWNGDRLVRHPKEFEHFVDVCENAGVSHYATADGAKDLTNTTDMFVLRILGAAAKKSSDDTSDRTILTHASLAEQGRWKGGPRPYGYDVKRDETGRPVKDGRLYVVPAEAKIIREAASRVLAGETVHGVCRDLNDRGVGTAQGAKWASQTMNRILTAWTVAGKREHHGNPVADGQWEAILDEVTHRRLRAALLTTATRAAPARVSLLSGGLIVCGNCGSNLHSQRRGDPHRTRVYVCMSGPGKNGCGRMSVVAEPVETLITETMFARLDTPDLWKTLSGPAAKDSVAADLKIVEEATVGLQEVRELWLAGEIDRDEFLDLRKGFAERRADAQHRIERSDTRNRRSPWIGNTLALRNTWPAMTLDQKRAVIHAVIDTVTIGPAARRGAGFDGQRVNVTWKQ